MTQNKKVKIDNEMIEYQINYKDIKKIYLRVEEGVIKISAPNLCPIELIENIIKDNYDKIKDKIINYKPYFEYRDNGFVYIFNKRYSIQLIDLKYKKAFFKKNKIIVYDQNIQKVIETELNKYLLNYLNDLVKKYCKIDSRFPLPKIELKKTKRRYGACYYKNNKISFNPILIHKSKEFIDYVVVHELCHFIEPNHSTAFYKEVGKLMPNYKNIMKEGKIE